MTTKLKAKDPKARFLSKLVAAKNGCIHWTGYIQQNGYGQTFLNGRLMPAHRAVYMVLHNVRLTRDQFVCHKCDNPRCCNIHHLFVGSCLDNMRDARQKGRHVSITKPETFKRGEESYRAKITELEVREIKRLLLTGMSCQKIADLFNITRSGVDKIKQHKAWKHVCLN